MPQLDAISFLFVLFLTATVLLALVFRYGFSSSLTIGDGLRFGLFWAVFVTVVLVMNQAARETLQPGRWANEKLFVPTVHGEVLGADEPVKNLLLGWLLFPMRTFPHTKINTEAVLTGIAVFFVAGIVLEIFGRKLVLHWQSRQTSAILIGFLLLDLMTYSAVGIVRQVGWILFS
jgi:hypothetical protein